VFLFLRDKKMNWWNVKVAGKKLDATFPYHDEENWIKLYIDGKEYIYHGINIDMMDWLKGQIDKGLSRPKHQKHFWSAVNYLKNNAKTLNVNGKRPKERQLHLFKDLKS
jgi:hypothetical protein